MLKQTSMAIIVLCSVFLGNTSSDGALWANFSNNGRTQTIKGIVVVDDIHGNDYTIDRMFKIFDDLYNLGFAVYFTSEFSNLSTALQYADHFIMNTPTTALPVNDIAAIVSWLGNGSHNLLISSRGDFGTTYLRTSINGLLTSLNSSIRVQDDNVYTTDSHNFQGNAWYVHTTN